MIEHDIDMTAIWRREGIRAIEESPAHMGGDFLVRLKCGGHVGRGPTIGAAIDNALALNAEYLDMLGERN